MFIFVVFCLWPEPCDVRCLVGITAGGFFLSTVIITSKLLNLKILKAFKWGASSIIVFIPLGRFVGSHIGSRGAVPSLRNRAQHKSLLDPLHGSSLQVEILSIYMFVCLSVITSYSLHYSDSKLTQPPPADLSYATSPMVSNVPPMSPMPASQLVPQWTGSYHSPFFSIWVE